MEQNMFLLQWTQLHADLYHLVELYFSVNA